MKIWWERIHVSISESAKKHCREFKNPSNIWDIMRYRIQSWTSWTWPTSSICLAKFQITTSNVSLAWLSESIYCIRYIIWNRINFWECVRYNLIEANIHQKNRLATAEITCILCCILQSMEWLFLIHCRKWLVFYLLKKCVQQEAFLDGCWRLKSAWGILAIK